MSKGLTCWRSIKCRACATKTRRSKHGLKGWRSTSCVWWSSMRPLAAAPLGFRSSVRNGAKWPQVATSDGAVGPQLPLGCFNSLLEVKGCPPSHKWVLVEVNLCFTIDHLYVPVSRQPAAQRPRHQMTQTDLTRTDSSRSPLVLSLTLCPGGLQVC